jgi:hypothetical protein
MASRIALQSACRDLYHKVDDPNKCASVSSPASHYSRSTRQTYKMEDLLEIEM